MIAVKKPREAIRAAAIVIFYAAFSLFYFNRLDVKWYIKNIFNQNINIAVPFLYVLLVLIFVCLYKILLKQKRNVAYPITAMAIVLSLFYLLADLKIGMLKINPFGGNRVIFGIYADLYFVSFVSLFSLLIGVLFRKLLKGKEVSPLIFHLPIFIYFVYVITAFFLNGLVSYALIFLSLFLSAFCFEKVGDLLNSLKALFIKFVTNDQFLLVAIFVIAFALRYLWGMRLLGITGSDFVIASDDGLTYSPFAATIAQGGIIPKEEVFYWSGFGYWYFLAAVYKIFGLYNFKAVIIIQSLLGATVPVFTYLIGRKIFNSRMAGIIASFMASINLTLVFLSVVIGMEAIYIPFAFMAMTIAVYFLVGMNFDYKKAFIIGCAFGLVNNTRSEILFFPFILAFLIFIFMREKLKMKKTLIAILSLCIGFVLLASIQHVTSCIKYGEYRLASGALATTFAGGYGSQENAILDSIGFNPFKSIEDSFRAFLNNSYRVSELMVKGFSKRIFIYYFGPNFGVFDPVYLVNPASGYFFRFPLWVQFYEYIFIFAGIFFAFMKRQNLIVKAILLLFAFYISGMYGFIWVTNSRHRGILIPIFLLFFAYGVEIFYKRLKAIYAVRTPLRWNASESN